jgi:predicted outer membrane protein
MGIAAAGLAAAYRQNRAAGAADVLSGSAGFQTVQFGMPAATAANQQQYRAKMMRVGTLSMMSSQIAVQRASNRDVRAFATFELNETTALATILREMGTAAPVMNAQDRALLNALRNARGIAFDRAYIRAQYDAHVFARNLTTSYLASARANRNRPNEMHARHIATLSLPTINEHIVHSQTILAQLRA